MSEKICFNYKKTAIVCLCISFFCFQAAFAGGLRREVSNFRGGVTSAEVGSGEREAAIGVAGFEALSLTPESSAVDDGLQWLLGNQNAWGSWGSDWEFADTCDVIHTLRDVAPDCNEVADGLDWLAWETAANYEFLARQIIALSGSSEYQAITDTLAADLLDSRNEAETDPGLPNWPDGGWGLGAGYETDCMTTAMAVCALKNTGFTGGLAVQNASLTVGTYTTYIFDVPDDATKIHVRIDSLSGGPIQVRMQEGSEPPWAGISYFPVSSAPVLITYPDHGVPFTPGTNYLRIDSPDAPATYSLTVSYETPDWDTRTIAEPLAYLRESQNIDGGWGLQRGVATDLYTTLHVLLALQEYSHYGNITEMANGMTWLRSQQLGDGSFGYSGIGEVTESSLAAFCLMGDDPFPYESDTLGAIGYLLSAQSGNGSWNSEPYDTALATLALDIFNKVPVADAGPDQSVIDADQNYSESVTLDGSGSSDVDGTIESYTWSEDGVQIATGVSPTVDLLVGTHTVQLEVTDDGNKTAIDEVIIMVTPQPQVLYSADMDTDPNWVAEGLWQWGVPLGNDGWHGNTPPDGPDPTSGFTGSNVYGYNLAGGYEDDLPETYLTTRAIDCTGYTNIQLTFYRWLCVESALFNGQPCDHARLEISTDSSDPGSWVVLYQNPDSTLQIDTAWTLQTYDISSVADGQSEVYIRWVMGTTDFTWNYGGWNIDDLELVGVPGHPDSPSTPDLLSVDDSGVSDSDDITGVELSSIDVYVSDPKAVEVRIFKEDIEVGSATDQDNGYWRYQFTAGQLSKGDNNITAKALGLSGYSDSSGSLNISYRPQTLSADFTGDGIVEVAEVALVAGYWLQNESSVDIAPAGGDNVIDLLDFSIVAQQWMQTELWYPVP
ncbi:MAG: hypothetical protein FVQ82_05315 [Planctomycetes bacterium]|nr:hypothetical protein [Planctomycetota bacterium]